MVGLLKSLFLWFYCLDLPEAAMVVMVGTVLFLLVCNRLGEKVWLKVSMGVVLACWAVAVLWMTVWARSGHSVFEHSLIPFHSYREVLNGGNVEIYRSNFMNVVLFYPAGLLATSLLPRKWSGWCRCVLVVLVLAAMSAGIEFLQYRYALGRCEIDDVIHNTVGALLGSLAALWVSPFLVFLKEKVKLE